MFAHVSSVLLSQTALIIRQIIGDDCSLYIVKVRSFVSDVSFAFLMCLL